MVKEQAKWGAEALQEPRAGRASRPTAQADEQLLQEASRPTKLHPAGRQPGSQQARVLLATRRQDRPPLRAWQPPRLEPRVWRLRVRPDAL